MSKEQMSKKPIKNTGPRLLEATGLRAACARYRDGPGDFFGPASAFPLILFDDGGFIYLDEKMFNHYVTTGLLGYTRTTDGDDFVLTTNDGDLTNGVSSLPGYVPYSALPPEIGEAALASNYYSEKPKKTVRNPGPRSAWVDQDYNVLAMVLRGHPDWTNKQIADELALLFDRPVTENAIKGAKYRLERR